MRYGTLAAILAMLMLMVGLGYAATGGSRAGAYYQIFLSMPDAYQHVWGYSLIAIMGALLIAYFSGLTVRAPILRALAMLGGISYEFYIVHRPVVRLYLHFVPVDGPLDWLLQGVVCVAVTIALAMLLRFVAAQVTAGLTEPANRPLMPLG